MGEEKVVLPDNAKEQAQVLLLAAKQAEDRLSVYIHGCKDCLGLDGNWNLNTKTWEFELVIKEDK